jgi:hypothetical protein
MLFIKNSLADGTQQNKSLEALNEATVDNGGVKTGVVHSPV